MQSILGSDWDGARDVGFAIKAASPIVDRVSSCAANKDVTLSSDELQNIEAWLAAHLYVQSDRTVSTESKGQASGSYQVGQLGRGFDSTQYGQTAIDLDYSGCLNNINKKQRAKALWLGKVTADQIDAADRST